MKRCMVCKQDKEDEDFAPYKRSKDKLAWCCKHCQNEYMKTYFNETANGRFRRLKYNAAKDNVPFDMSREVFSEWLTTQELKCFYCETELEFVYGRHWQWNGLTIDRTNPAEGYKIGNIVLACRRCNIIKGHWFTKEQMLEIATKYLRG